MFWRGIELGLLGGFIGSLAGSGLFLIITGEKDWLKISFAILFIFTFILIWFITMNKIRKIENIKSGRPRGKR